jgi:hypothetical protein
MGSIIYVHGTGVRKKGYEEESAVIRNKLSQFGDQWKLVECFWGDEHGVKLHLGGKAIPQYQGKAVETEEVMRWWRLYREPLYELQELGALDIDQALVPPGQQPAWMKLRDAINVFKPSETLQGLLKEIRMDEVWDAALESVRSSEAYDDAVERSAAYPGHFRRAFARAVFAQATVLASENGVPAPTGADRDQIVDLMVKELGGDDMGLPDLGKMAKGSLKFLVNLAKVNLGTTGLATGVIGRGKVSDNALPVAGDILLYQVRGEAIRDCIKQAIKSATPPIYLLAHSLGGVACVDLLAMEQLPVAGLITAGSQAGLFYEMNCLRSLEAGHALPASFPKRWINFYDPNDLLGYLVAGVFPNGPRDIPVASRQPFPQAHSAYWREASLWTEIKNFLQ